MNAAREIVFGFVKKIKSLHAAQLRIKAEREARLAFSRLDIPPILIYQMGKVGSSTVYKSLKSTPLSDSVLHLHFLSTDLSKIRERYKKIGIYPPPYHIYLGESVRKILCRNPNLPCKIISLVRDPIAVVVSSVFQNPHFAAESLTTHEDTIDPEKAIQYLNRKLREPSTFSYVNQWFDKELKRVLDVDVFAKPFPVDVGYAVCRNRKVEALVIRLEDLSQRGPKAISEFLNLDAALVLEQRNVRNELMGGESYGQVLKRICLSPSVCREIYSSKFVRHFYDDAMIEQLVSKWTQHRFNLDASSHAMNNTAGYYSALHQSDS
jgi:Putative capsular polysaccharide synthesis protein